MLRTLTYEQLWEWIAYEKLEPFGEERADLRAALVAMTVANVNRGKDQKAYTLADFTLVFGEQELRKAKPMQPWQKQKGIMMMIAKAANAK